MRNRRFTAAVVALMALLVACSGGADAEVTEARERLGEVEAELLEMTAERDDLAVELSAANDAARTAADDVTDLRAERDELSEQIEVISGERDAALADAEALRLQYDPQIRQALRAEADAQIELDCTMSAEAFDQPMTYRFDASWSAVITEADYRSAVDACAAPERDKSAEERETERLEAFTTIDVDEVIKNPDAYEGRGVVVYARIVQYDVNTGSCAFHAEMSASRSTLWYDYDQRAQFGYGDDELAQYLTSNCPDLDGIDGDDYVKVWATGAGSYTYDTSIGGMNTVPLFSIDKIELVQKA